jgi:hypothetical protein
MFHQEPQEEIEQKGRNDGKNMEDEVQQGEDVGIDGEVKPREDLVIDDDVATDPESKKVDQLEEVFREWISANGFAALWMLLGMWCRFRYADSRVDLRMMKRPVFCVLYGACNVGFGWTFGSPSFILDRTLKLSRFQGMLIWFLGYFACLAVDMDVDSFVKRQSADYPLSCLPMYFSTTLVFVFVATHGPWSLVLFPLRLIYNYLANREEDARSFAMKLCTLMTIELLLYINCQYNDQRFNDSSKSVLNDKGGAELAKYTLTIFHDIVMPVTKTVLSLALLCVLGIFATLILLDTAIWALRFVRRRPAWFRGHMHLD